ncbi:MAG: hypothetical protein J6D28_04520 [Bacilli bacterium]|nr:hypothetical protein [Bacilli bacterium]
MKKIVRILALLIIVGSYVYLFNTINTLTRRVNAFEDKYTREDKTTEIQALKQELEVLKTNVETNKNNIFDLENDFNKKISNVKSGLNNTILSNKNEAMTKIDKLNNALIECSKQTPSNAGPYIFKYCIKKELNSR